MPLQNRVDPFGRLVAVQARGTLTGNRGILHDEHRTIVRSSASTAWITCALEWKGRTRPVMTGRTWTELFFLDEATALAAGHRPCAHCRRADYVAFVAAWSAGNPDLAPSGGPRAPVIDGVLRQERRTAEGSRVTTTHTGSSLPRGTMILWRDRPHLVLGGGLVTAWSFERYVAPQRFGGGPVAVLTPASTLRALTNGYVPALHPSAAN